MEQYILKSALVAEIENWKQYTLECGYKGQGDYEDGNKQGRLDTCDKFLSFIDTLEVKEVDLEIPMWVREVPREDVFDDGWRIGFDDCLHRKGYKIKICDLWKLPKEPLNV